MNRMCVGYLTMQLPHEIPVMALPNAVLFPNAMMPLHIFEPRYRQMLSDCLAAKRVFSVTLMKRGWEKFKNSPPSYDIIGIGLIRASTLQPDGTSHLILQGIARAQVVDFCQRDPYPVAKINILTTNHRENVQVDALAAKLAELIQDLAQLGHTPPESILKFIATEFDPEQLADLASGLLLKNYYAKQKLLETLDLRIRLRLLLHFLKIQKNASETKIDLNEHIPKRDFSNN